MRMRLPAKLMTATLLALLGVWFLSTRLSMAPVPWPDGAAYYIPGVELVSSHPHWRMHNQAAFIPSYDEASFNIPPGLPFLLGVADLLGVNRAMGAEFGIRAVSILGLLFLGWFVFKIASRELRAGLAIMLGLAVVVDPISRWGAMAVRTEIWVALTGVFLFGELLRKEPRLWRISLALALGALFHYDAIILVPAAIIGLFPEGVSRPDDLLKEWWRRLWQVGVRTLIWLAPFILYTALHFQLFIEQMGTQFARLSHGNFFIGKRAAYDAFHALFLDFGNAAGPPKFFNLGKIVLWTAIAVSFGAILRKRFKHSWATGATFLSALYLWATKPEVWFVSLAHFLLWPFLACVLMDLQNNARKRTFLLLASLASIYFAVSLISTQMQSQHIAPTYSWKNYQAFEACIERQIPAYPASNYRVWELGYPDVLVDLRYLRDDLDLTRPLDFPDKLELALEKTSSYQMIIFNNYGDYPAELGDGIYEGAPRGAQSFDGRLLLNGRIPYGETVWRHLNQPENISQWNFKICEGGPFWATLALKK